jgi:hypothetical protein
MRFPRLARTACLALLLACLLAPPASPQASTGVVSGTVRDASGAVIPGATVVLTNTNTNGVSRTAANDAGFYMLPGVLPGPYRLTAEAPGMQKYEASLTVQTQQSAVVDVTLRVGATSTEVSVKDVTPMVTVDNPTLGAVLERQRIEQLPLNGRALTSLLGTVPGMEGTRAYGLRNYSFEFTLDGASLADRYGYYNITLRQPGLDSIQEFKVENNNSSAKFTRPTTIVVTTKGGTNQLHGTAFETNRNNGVGLARSRTDYYTKPPFLNRNEFGASAGGPVYIPKVYNGKDKTFWFFSYEGLRNIAPTTTGYAVPTAEMRNGDMSGLIYSGNVPAKIYDPWTTDATTWARQQFNYGGKLNAIDPKLISPLAKVLFSATPLPTMPDVNPNIAYNWYGSVANTQRSWTTSTRVDHRFGEKDQVYGRYTQGNFSSLGPTGGGVPSTDWAKVPGNTQSNFAPNKSLAVSHVHTFSPTLFNELLVSMSRQPWINTIGDPSRMYADELGLPNPFKSNLWPAIHTGPFTGSGGSGYMFGTFNATGQSYWYTILDDNVTKIKGKHEFQFGVHYRRDSMDMLPQQQQVGGGHGMGRSYTALYDSNSSRTEPLLKNYSGDPIANLFLGTMNMYANHFSRGKFYARGKEAAMYLQDNFRVTPRLTLNLGMRWEFNPPFTEKNNLLVGFDPKEKAVVLGRSVEDMISMGATLPSVVNRFTALGMKFTTPQQAGLPDTLVGTNYTNFGPRVGFAYRAGSGDKPVVIRGGYRISYFHLPMSDWSARMRSNSPMDAWFYNDFTSAEYAPDGISQYAVRSVPTLIAGKNTSNAVTLDNANSLTPGAAWVSYMAKGMPDPRVQDWNLTLEREIMENTVVRGGYFGNRTSHLEQLYQYNGTTPDYIWYTTQGVPKPTGIYAGVGTNNYDRTLYSTLEEWRNTGWGNANGIQLEVERRFSKGFGYQLFYVLTNSMAAGGKGYSGSSVISELNQFLPGAVPTDMDERNRFLNYQRDITTPKHRVSWNWLVDLPIGKGKPLLGSAGGLLNRVVGGWQIAGMGGINSNYLTLPATLFPTGNKLEMYDYKYPIQDCTSGKCFPGYLWYNGYIPANQINSVNPTTGKPNGYMGIPADYKPGVAPLLPWPSTPVKTDPMYAYYGGNTLWVPLKNGNMQRTTWSGLQPLRNQFLPSVLQWWLNASLYKNIPITERVSTRLNADFFNVLNHPGNPNSVGNTGILSTQASGNGPRQLQLTLRVTW